MADDYRNDTTTIGRLAINGQRSGNFEVNNDSDWYQVALTAGVTYLFSLNGAAQGGGTLANVGQTTLYVMGPEGYAVATSYYNPSSQTAPVVQYTASGTGTYYLAAGTNYDAGTYTLKSWLPAADDFSADIGSTGAFADGGTVAGVFERRDDVDWFRFHAEAGQVIDLTASMATPDGTVPGMTVYDSEGYYAASIYQTPFIATRAGDYFLAVAAGQVGAYTATMAVLADDYSADNSRAGSVQPGGQASGVAQYRGDVDRFQMSVQAGQFYTVTLAKSVAGAGSVGMQLRDSAGNYLSGDSRNVDGAQTVKFLATQTGTYSLDVSGSYDLPAGGVAYTLKVSEPLADDYGNTRGTATLIALDQTVAGQLQAPSDVDMFKVALRAGVTYRIDAPTVDNALSNGVSLSDVNGNTLRYASASEKSFTFTPTASGTYYLAQSGSYYAGDGLVDYSVTVSAAKDDHGANAASAGRLAVGQSVKGELEAGGGDVDWYAVTLEAGNYYWFTLSGAREGGGTLSSSGSAVLRVLDAQGNAVARADYAYSGTASVLPYTAATKGIYYVEVASPGYAGTYTVKAQLGEKDDYGNDLSHASAVSADVAVAGKLELATDRDVFKLSAAAGMTFAVEVVPGAGSWSYNGLDISSGGGGYVSTRDLSSGGKLYKVFEATRADDYYIVVGGNSSNSVTGTYTMTVKSLGLDDFPATPLSTGLVTPAAPLKGTLGMAGDHDWVKVSLEAGRTYVFDLQGSLSGGGTLDTTATYSRPGMTLLTVDGGYTGIGSGTGSGSGAGGAEPRLSVIASKTGDYFIDVFGYDNQTGSYTIVETVTSGDVTAPKLVASTVPAGAVNVSPTGKLVLTFDEIMMVGTGVTLTTADGAAVAGGALATPVGKTVVIDPAVNLTPGVTYTLNLPAGGLLDLAGNSAAQSYSFTVKAPVAYGTAGNDYLVGAGDGLALAGLAGLDTVSYAGSRASLHVTRNADGTANVQDYGKPTGDVLISVERLLFADGAVALDIDGVGGQAYRMYQSAFGRSPDYAGIGLWMSAMDDGMSLKTVAQAFVGSAEFAQRYGSAPTDAEFVNLLYNNVLHRAPEPAGNTFWLGHLAAGLSRADALLAFSESAENTAAVAQVIANGFGYTPYG